MKLEDREWGEFPLTQIFKKIQRGKRLRKADHKDGLIPYASSSAINNGIDGFIGNVEGVRIFENCLTIANSGSVGVAFYQPFKVVASDHVTKLENENFNKYIYLFLASMLSRLSEKYSFNREINNERIKKEKIILPINEKGKPDYDFMETYVKEKESDMLKKYFKHNKLIYSKIEWGGVNHIIEWGEFFIEDIFKVKSGKRLTKADMIEGKTPFIGATDSNNGITAIVGNRNSSLDENVLGVNYNGSVVHNFYHPYKAIFSDDVKRVSLKDKRNNKFTLLFVKQVILNQKSKYEYGYKFNGTRMKRQKILLPINSNSNPDYEYMENYMRYLEQKKLRQYYEYKMK